MGLINFPHIIIMVKLVPENITKKAARDAKLLKATVEARAAAKTARVASRAAATANAVKYAAEYAKEDSDLIEAKRAAKKAGNFYVEGEAKIAFVIRTRGINKLSPKCKKIMQLLRLRQLHNGVFVRMSRANVSRLVYKRGYGKVNRSRIPLTDNSIIAGA